LPLDLPGGKALNPRRHPLRLSPTRLGETSYLNFALRNIDPDAIDLLSDELVRSKDYPPESHAASLHSLESFFESAAPLTLISNHPKSQIHRGLKWILESLERSSASQAATAGLGLPLLARSRRKVHPSSSVDGMKTD
jgi:hypothetical protein